MHDRRDPWKWPVTIGLVVSVLWAAVFVLPRSWLGFLLAPGAAVTEQSSRPDRDILTLLPPLMIEVVPAPSLVPPDVIEPPQPPVPDDPRWWTEG